MKKLFSYLLLLSFITLSTPRDWVHDCEHEHHEYQADSEDKSSVTFEADDCFACDYSLSSFSIHHFSDVSVDVIHYYSQVFTKIEAPESEYPFTHCLRGPPQNELS